MSNEQSEIERLRAQLARAQVSVSELELSNEALTAQNRRLEANTRALQDLHIRACEDLSEMSDEVRRLENSLDVDHLTRLQNKRSLHKTIEAIERNNDQVFYLFMDLNNFKKVNDTKGHEFGDRILQEFATCVWVAAMRAGISRRRCYRYGGDEFVVITNSSEAALKIEADIKRLFGRRQYFEAVVSIECGISDDIHDADQWLMYWKQLRKKEGLDHLAVHWPEA